MKTIDMSTKVSAAAYLSNPPEKTHTKEELDQLHACIRYTQLFKHEESMNKMDEESPIEMPLSRSNRKLEQLKKLGIGRFK